MRGPGPLLCPPAHRTTPTFLPPSQGSSFEKVPVWFLQHHRELGLTCRHCPEQLAIEPPAGWGLHMQEVGPGPRRPAHPWHSSHASHFHVARPQGQAGHVGTCRVGWGLLLSPFRLPILPVAAGQDHETYWPHRVHTLQGVRIRVVLLNWGDCAPSKHLATSRDAFSLHNWGRRCYCTGIEGTDLSVPKCQQRQV